MDYLINLFNNDFTSLSILVLTILSIPFAFFCGYTLSQLFFENKIDDNKADYEAGRICFREFNQIKLKFFILQYLLVLLSSLFVLHFPIFFLLLIVLYSYKNRNDD